MRHHLISPILAVTMSASALAATFPGSGGVTYDVVRSDDKIQVIASGPGTADATLFVALGDATHAGSRLVPFVRNHEGSTVFLPFRATSIIIAAPQQTSIRTWDGTIWSDRQPTDPAISSTRADSSISLTLPAALAPGPFRLTAYLKNSDAADGWGETLSSLGPDGPTGTGDMTLASFVSGVDSDLHLRGPANSDAARVRIYQFLPRLFGNTNETRKPNGFIEDNGSGKFSDLNEAALRELKAMGFTHLWATGVLQQATATDYADIGEPADDPDLLKGLAGSPYAIKDYFDVSPDYADDPANRLAEFRAMVDRVHAAGMKVLIDFVPNHVARSHKSSVRPDHDFGADDDRTKFFAPANNFFYLTPEAKPYGKGPPLRLPTVDSQGRPASATCKVVRTPCDGLFAPEAEHGRVTGNNLVSWAPDAGSWYETIKLNYGYDFTDPNRATRAYPHGGKTTIPIPDTWIKMDEIIAYWQDLGVDGFRVDMAHMVPPEFWHWMIARARTRQPDGFFAAEAYDSDPSKVPAGDPLVAEVGGGNVMFDLLNAGFDAVYDDVTYDKLKAIYEDGAWANDLDAIRARPFVFDNSLRYAENHDEARLAAKGEWGDVGMNVGRPVTALLFALSRGPVMLYHGQEVGEPADGVEGFGVDDARTSIFDYWSMPEFTKWVNDQAYDGGRLSPDQKALRAYYARLVPLMNEPAFRNGDFIPLNPANVNNPAYGRLPGEDASGHWLYAFLRHDPVTTQTFLVLVNLNPDKPLNDITINLPPDAATALSKVTTGPATLTDRLNDNVPPISVKLPTDAITCPTLPPLTARLLEIKTPG